MKRILYSAITILALTLAGCSSGTAPATKKEVKPPEPIGGQSAAFEMYKAARQWSGDAQILSMENMNLDGVKSEGGKAGAWRAIFVSLTNKRQKTFTYGVIEEGTIRKGAYSTDDMAYIPKAQTRVIPIQRVKVDTVEALEVAKTELKQVVEKNPGTPVQFQMEWTFQTVNPVWRVIFGTSISQSLGSVFVDAETGKFVKKAR